MFNSLPDEKKGALLVMMAALCYGFLYFFGSRVMHEGFSPYNTIFWRFTIASIAIFSLLLPRLKKLHATPKEIGTLLLFGATFHGTAASLYFVAANSIGSGLAVVLLFTHPITVLIFNRIFYKAKISGIFYLVIILVITGTILVSNIGNANFNLSGVLIGMLAAVFFGLYIVSSKSSNIESSLSAFIICAGCVVVCFIFTLIDGSFAVPQTASAWSNILALGAVCTALPILLFLRGLKYITSEKAAILSMLEPPSVMLIGFIFLAERISFLQFLGTLMVLLAALVVIIAKPSKKKGLVLETMI